MITAIIYRREEKIYGFQISGHAGYAQEGEDIVCAAVSVLALNTTNAIEAFTQEPLQAEADMEDNGFLKVMIPLEGAADHDAQLLLRTLELGLSGIENEYKQYLTLIHKEV
jgi:Predicted ribosomal protein